MSSVLLIDSVHKELCVAFINTKTNCVKFRIHTEQRQHDKNIVRLVRELMFDCDVTFEDIDAYACVVGPGSWTGCRVGVACIKGFAIANPRPVLAINCLDTIWSAWKKNNLLDTRTVILHSSLDNYFVLKVLKQGEKIVKEYGSIKLDSSDKGFVKKYVTLEEVGVEKYRNELVNQVLKKMKSNEIVNASDLTPFYITDFVVKK